MGRRIRWLGIVMLLCFGLVVVQLVNIQFVKAKALANSPFNPRVSKNVLDNQRGTIYAADGTVLAQSVKSTSTSPDSPHYMRVYPQGPLFAGITGFSDVFYGSPSGIEYQYNQYLQTHAQAPQNFSQLLFNKPPSEPDDVTLTVDPVLQQAASNGAVHAAPGPNKDGAVVVLESRPTGPCWPWCPIRPSTPMPWPTPNVTAEETAHFSIRYPITPRNSFRIDPIATAGTLPARFDLQGGDEHGGLQPQTEPGELQLPVGRVRHLQRTRIVPLCNDSGERVRRHHGRSCCPRRATRVTPSWGVQVGQPVMTQQAQAVRVLRRRRTKNPFIPNLDIPNVIPSTFSNLPANAQSLLGLERHRAVQRRGHCRCRTPWWRPGIANGGVIMTPHLMQQIRDSQGNVVTTYQPTPMLTASTQAAAASVNTLMQSVATSGDGGRGLPGLLAHGGQDGYGAGAGAGPDRADRRLDDRVPDMPRASRRSPSPWWCRTKRRT